MPKFDPEDPKQFALYKEAMAAVENAWNSYLRFSCCVGCAKLDIIQIIDAIAQTKSRDIIGIDFLNEWAMRGGSDDELPLQRDGIFRHCEYCENKGQG
jgi:hypothetical protein